ncbi:hypothetical protein WN944_027967 [Citrus x changshan-huyou]|uniref:Plastocyanin-like domain-containing protein n=1 Tax=Citrus x changshan-huyou TaxID=2935761 RepID=A0AAP0QDG0_9ROSI
MQFFSRRSQWNYVSSFGQTRLCSKPTFLADQIALTHLNFLQNRSILRAESHPLQLHGFNFFVVEQGSGNFDPNKHPSKFNLFDPIERNAEWCALGGWVALRFLAHNPVVCMVHVLPPASTHKLGIEGGMD